MFHNLITLDFLSQRMLNQPRTEMRFVVGKGNTAASKTVKLDYFKLQYATGDFAAVDAIVSRSNRFELSMCSGEDIGAECSPSHPDYIETIAVEVEGTVMNIAPGFRGLMLRAL